MREDCATNNPRGMFSQRDILTLFFSSESEQNVMHRAKDLIATITIMSIDGEEKFF
jgi:hypothetical protein